MPSLHHFHFTIFKPFLLFGMNSYKPSNVFPDLFLIFLSANSFPYLIHNFHLFFCSFFYGTSSFHTHLFNFSISQNTPLSPTAVLSFLLFIFSSFLLFFRFFSFFSFFFSSFLFSLISHLFSFFFIFQLFLILQHFSIFLWSCVAEMEGINVSASL